MDSTSSPRAAILFVDDEPDIRQSLGKSLEAAGYEVHTAADGGEALEAMKSFEPNLVLLDLTMPGMDGFEACARIQELRPLLPTVILTARQGLQDKERAFKAGATDFLTKPIGRQVLLDKVEENLERSRRWTSIGRREGAQARERSLRIRASDYKSFRNTLFARHSAPAEKTEGLPSDPSQLYALAGPLGIGEKTIARELARFLDWPFLESIDPAWLRLGVLPTSFCRTNRIVPIIAPDEGEGLVLCNPFSWELQDVLRNLVGTGQTHSFFISPPASIRQILENDRSTATATGDDSRRGVAEIKKLLENEYAPADFENIPESDEDSGPIILLINNLIESAYRMGASDIHIEPWEREVLVRFRIDGALRVMHRLRPRSLIRRLMARIKVMSEMDIAERRLPQDGRIAYKNYNRRGLDVDLRVSTVPVNFGEKACMRILDKHRSVLPLGELGFSDRNLKIFRDEIRAPHGMILHVGPTGSGKSMTLYAALNEVMSPEVNIQTAEDPIEYTLPGLNQLQVKPDIGLTFGRALRSFLRQDPDIILVGEIRDRETAQIAVEAAMTGHLLLSTLHTNDSAGTLTRLIEMGIDPVLVSSSVVLVCAQRLVRRLCTHCRVVRQLTDDERQIIGIGPEARVEAFRAAGCEHCNDIGYRGRIGVHELLVPNDRLRLEFIQPGISSERLKRLAVAETGMRTLFRDVMEKVAAGITSLEEALAHIARDEWDDVKREE